MRECKNHKMVKEKRDDIYVSCEECGECGEFSLTEKFKRILHNK